MAARYPGGAVSQAELLVAAEVAEADHQRAEQARTDLALQQEAAYNEQLARLGARKGTLHQLLREYDREERRGEHRYPGGSTCRAFAPAEDWLYRAWHDICGAHPDLFAGPDPDTTARG